MKFRRRQFLHLAVGAGAGALPAVSRIARADTYPSRPARIIVGFAPGGATDTTARLVGQWLSEHLGQQFIVENRVGAGTNIATEAVVRSAPDGYTLLMVTASNAINATLYEKLNYSFLRDMVPVAGVIRYPNVVEVNNDLPVKTIPEFIAYLKANPGKISMASGGVGSSQHLAGELFKMMTGVEMTHVPYRGGAPALIDLVGGRVQVRFGVLPESIALIKEGKLRALAVTTATRNEFLPDVPTVGDYVKGYEASSVQGIAAPRGTPPEIIEKLNKEINASLADPKMKARFADLGSSVFPVTPAEFGRFLADETEKWGQVVKFSGAKAE
jgi:tripartite-type tricarboxylate transporter receptor subunit TctC